MPKWTLPLYEELFKRAEEMGATHINFSNVWSGGLWKTKGDRLTAVAHWEIDSQKGNKLETTDWAINGAGPAKLGNCRSIISIVAARVDEANRLRPPTCAKVGYRIPLGAQILHAWHSPRTHVLGGKIHHILYRDWRGRYWCVAWYMPLPSARIDTWGKVQHPADLGGMSWSRPAGSKGPFVHKWRTNEDDATRNILSRIGEMGE